MATPLCIVRSRTWNPLAHTTVVRILTMEARMTTLYRGIVVPVPVRLTPPLIKPCSRVANLVTRDGRQERS